jgi:hypothetical protein
MDGHNHNYNHNHDSRKVTTLHRLSHGGLDFLWGWKHSGHFELASLVEVVISGCPYFWMMPTTHMQQDRDCCDEESFHSRPPIRRLRVDRGSESLPTI